MEANPNTCAPPTGYHEDWLDNKGSISIATDSIRVAARRFQCRYLSKGFKCYQMLKIRAVSVSTGQQSQPVLRRGAVVDLLFKPEGLPGSRSEQTCGERL